jgi:hypothetical protein
MQERMQTITTTKSSSSDETPSYISLFPPHLQHQLLLQAWQQLDHHTRYGIVPRVNRQWHQLSSETLTSLTLTLSSGTSPRSFAFWLQNHPHTPLQHLSLDVEYLDVSEAVISSLLQAICNPAASFSQKLRSLHLANLPLNTTQTSLMTSLTALTSLRLRGCNLLQAATLQPLLALTQLKTLDLTQNPFELRGGLLRDLSSALQQLEVLELMGSNILEWELPLLQNFPRLKKVAVPIGATRGDPFLQGCSPLRCSNIAFDDRAALDQQQIAAYVQEARGVLQRVTASHLRTPELLTLVTSLGAAGDALRNLHLVFVDLEPALPALLSLTQLTCFSLVGCRQTREHLSQLLGALSGLRELSLDQGLEHRGVGPAYPSESAIPELAQLTSLGLISRTEAELQGALGALQSFPKLSKCTLSGSPSLQVLREHMDLLTNLECLDLDMVPERALAEALVPLQKLRRLQLRSKYLLGGTTVAMEARRQQLPVEALAFTCLTQLKVLDVSLGYPENCTFKEKVRTADKLGCW